MSLEIQQQGKLVSSIASATIGSVIVQLRGMIKRFPGVTANDKIDFELRKGEIHCLLGENGAGKTVLMSTLYGLYRADEGEIYVGGKRVEIRSPGEAIRLGIGMVHQQFALVDALSVLENIALGSKSAKEIFLDLDEAEKKVVELCGRYGLTINSRTLVKDLSAGERQRVEVLKLLYRSSHVLILDEPTTMLTPQQSQGLFNILRSMVKEGLSIIFVTHKIPEVMAVSDRVTVLRNGRVVGTVSTAQTNERELVNMMVGREVLLRLPKNAAKIGGVLLKVEGLWAKGEEKTYVLKDVSLSVNQGEIFGIAGVAGNGQKELVECLMGLRKVERGSIIINEEDVTNYPPRKIIEKNVSWIPDDRRRGVISDFSLEENLILKNYYTPQFSSRLVLKREDIREFAHRLISEYDIKTPSSLAQAGQLSGGNIQRLIVARELAHTPRLTIAENPTQGLDVRLTEFVHNKLIEQRDRGTAVLLVSMDLDEVLSLSDRIAVIYRGQMVGVTDAQQAEIDKLGLMMTGIQGT